MKKALIFGFAVLFLSPAFTNAQSISVRVQPTLIEEKVDPGDVINRTLRVTNLSNVEMTYYLTKENVSGISETGQPIFNSDEKTGFEMDSWINYSTDAIVLLPDETRDIPFTVTVPTDATPGGHFSGVFVTSVPPKLRESGTGVGYQVGAILSFRISGDILEDGRIREFSTDKPLYGNAEVPFSLLVENLGNTLIRPRGLLEIYNIFGDKVSIVRVNDSAGAVLPKGNRAFEATWKGDGLSFGRYEAILALSYGDEARKTMTANVSFWVLPVKIIVPVFGGLLVLLLVVYGFAQWQVRRTLRGMGVDVVGGKQVDVKMNQRSKLTTIALSLIAFAILFFIILLILFQ